MNEPLLLISYENTILPSAQFIHSIYFLVPKVTKAKKAPVESVKICIDGFDC